MATTKSTGTKGAAGKQKPKPNYEEALARLNEQSKRGGGDKDYIELKEGKNVVRILPGHPNMDAFYEEVYYHRKSVGRKKSVNVICLNHGDSNADDCPICTALEEVRRSRDKGDKQIWSEQRPKARFFMNAIDRTDNSPKILACGISVMKQILGFVTDEEYGDILDVQEGTDLIITRTGEGLDTEYDVKARRNSSPVFEEEDEIEALIGTSAKNSKLVDLTEMKSQFADEPDKVQLVWEEGWEALKDLDDEDEPKKSSKKSSKKSRDDDDDDEEEEDETPKKKASVKKRAKPEPEEEEDEDTEDEDEEEEVTPPKKSKKSVAKPAPKKSKLPEPEDEDEEDEDDEEEEPAPKKSSKKPLPKKSTKKVREEEDEDEDEEDMDDLDSVLREHEGSGKKRK